MRDLWGDPVKRCGDYCVFHDESEPSKRWLLIGLLFVQRLHLDEVQAVLRHVQRTENCVSEIHFSALPKSFGGQWGAKARVLHDRVFFSALAVDRYCPRYEHKRFTEDFHAYNRFTAMALKAGIAWHLGPQRLDELSIHFVSDAKDRASRPGQRMIENFENYLPYRTELDAFLNHAGNRSYPWVNLELSLQDSASDDLLQLCDLLLGAT
jgi:hypothetical protein